MNEPENRSSAESCDLKPCPFCGERRIFLNGPSSHYLYGSINCPACLVTLPAAIKDKDQDELIRCWNDRAPQAAALGVNDLVRVIAEMPAAEQYDLAFKVAENVGYSVVPTPAQGAPECRHETRDAREDHIACRSCGMVRTDGGWGIASRRWFKDLPTAKFFEQHGRLPESAVINFDRAKTIEECASLLETSYPDNANTNAFCAAIRSLAAQPPAAPVETTSEPASERWTVGKNGWDASDEATREDI